MRKLSQDIRRKVFRMWFEGYAYRDISNKSGLGLGTISRIIEEYRKKSPDIDELRRLNQQLKKTDLSFYDAIRGAACLEKLNQLGVSLNELETYNAMIKKIVERQTVKSETFVDSAMRLIRLESKTGRTYIEIVKEFATKKRGAEALTKRIKYFERRIVNLDRELKKLNEQITRAKADSASVSIALRQLIETQERLRRLGLERIGKMAEFVENFELLGYNTKAVQELADLKKELLKIQVNPRDLRSFIRNKRWMDNQVRKLETQVRKLNEQKNVLSRQNESLQIASDIIEKKTTQIACTFCGGALIIPLTSRQEIEHAIEKSLICLIKCFQCGRMNRIRPRDVLASIGWALLK